MLARVLKVLVTAHLLGLSIPSCAVYARLEDGRFHGNMPRMPTVPVVRLGARASLPVTSINGSQLPAYNEVYYFDQLIDHNRPHLGTFKQRYWHTWEYYKPGGPIILSTPGETNANFFSSYLTNMTIMGMIAQETNGATIVLEHRFFGESNPYADLTVKSLRVHTIQQAIEDLEYFAENVVLPMPGGDKVTPDRAPWIFAGGSYAGALASWVKVSKPNLFFAAYSSSGVVQAKIDFWEYFEPIREYMPSTCSEHVQSAVARLDTIFQSGNETRIKEIKKSFGLSDLTSSIDFLGALRNNLWDWQQLQPLSSSSGIFFRFCSQLDARVGVPVPADGQWTVDHTILAWGRFWRREYYPYLCGIDDPETCLSTANPSSSYWTDTSTDNKGRSWFWTVCNEVGYMQSAAPEGRPSLVSRMIQEAYDLRPCQLMFPEAFGSRQARPRVELTNLLYRGWNVLTERIIFVNGARDPWRDVTMSSKYIKPRTSPLQQVHTTDGYHCSDMTAEGSADPTIAQSQRTTIETMKTWLKSYGPRPSRPNRPPPNRPTPPNRSGSPRPPRERHFKKTSAWSHEG